MEFIGWFGTALVLFGAFLNTKKKIACWHFYNAGNIMLLTQSIELGVTNMATIYFFFVCLNIYGYLQWRKDNEDKEI